MEAFDTALRLMLLGQILLISLVLSVRGPRAVSIPLVLLMISIGAYLIHSSAALSAAVPLAHVLLLFLAMSAPYMVWGCAYVLFQFEKPPNWLLAALPVFTVVMCIMVATNGSSPPFVKMLSNIASLIVVLHAVYAVVSGSLDDLSGPRRRFRFYFVTCIACCAALILALEIAFTGQLEPTWLKVLNTSAIAAVIMVISVPLLTRPADLLPEQPPEAEESDEQKLSAADQQTHEALLDAMENRAYARTGLTIRQLAEELNTPEHQLRALINSRLGFKNFSTFLNGYRIAETCRRLTDATQARTPILTIALDAGFASLAPFNRAFKAETGMTPSEYRRERLEPGSVVTPLRR